MDLDVIEQTLNQVVIDGAWTYESIFGNAKAREMIKVGDPFFEVNVDIIKGKQKSLGPVGSRLWRRRGVMTFTTYVPVGSGTRESAKIEQEILDTFEGQTFTGIVFDETSHKPIGTIDKWTLKSLRLGFYFNITGR